MVLLQDEWTLGETTAKRELRLSCIRNAFCFGHGIFCCMLNPKTSLVLLLI